MKHIYIYTVYIHTHIERMCIYDYRCILTEYVCKDMHGLILGYCFSKQEANNDNLMTMLWDVIGEKRLGQWDIFTNN